MERIIMKFIVKYLKYKKYDYTIGRTNEDNNIDEFFTNMPIITINPKEQLSIKGNIGI